MNFLETKLRGVYVVKTNLLTDSRGAFARFFCKKELADLLESREIVQVNSSVTKSSGAIRGMHFQHPPYSEMKLVRCVNGRVWDVVVDLRSESPTFLEWHAEELSSENTKMIVIPEGCAHGYQSLVAGSELLYLHTEFYMPDSEDGLAYNDPLLNITWPLPITDVSVRDQEHPRLTNLFSGIKI